MIKAVVNFDRCGCLFCCKKFSFARWLTGSFFDLRCNCKKYVDDCFSGKNNAVIDDWLMLTNYMEKRSHFFGIVKTRRFN